MDQVNMRNLTVEQMKRMPSKEWVKRSLFKDDLIIEKTSKQKYYDISYVKDGQEKQTGIWAVSLEEAESKATFKYWGCSNIKVEEYKFNNK